ncbi:MAG: Fe-S cluster assembly protein SufD [Candidatus Krumholzibacteriia bacterium]
MNTATLNAAARYADLFPGYLGTLRSLGINGAALREQGLTRVQGLGFSVARREEWKYGDIRPLAEGAFMPRPGLVKPLAGLALPAEIGALRLVFVNGRFQPDLSSPLVVPPAGLTIGSLAEAGDTKALGTVADISDAAVTALNTAFWHDGLKLELAAGARIEQPIELVFVTDGQAEGALVAPRNLITAGPGSKATVIERYVGGPEGQVLVAPVTEVICGENAGITHLKWFDETEGVLHYGSSHVRQESGSTYRSREFLLGGGLLRREVHLALAGSGATCELAGLTLAAGGQKADVRTRVLHDAPGCTTDELYKGLFLGKSQGVFDGMIKVARDSQQTQAFQTNRNLLLSEDAVSRSIPRLEIYADDVKCSHGSTTGQLSDDQVFYLRSRGFDEATARNLLAYAFAGEVVEPVEVPALRDELIAAVHAKLDRGL